jgi:hypothetical protein
MVLTLTLVVGSKLGSKAIMKIRWETGMRKVLFVKVNNRPVEQAVSVKLYEAFLKSYVDSIVLFHKLLRVNFH